MNYRELMSRLMSIYDSGEARAILRLVMDSFFNMSWTDVLGGSMESMTAEQQVELEKIMLSLEKGEPVQYVLGEAVFCGRTFHVEPGVLIPRPETELLVLESTYDFIGKLTKPSINVLDIGTGSGCIAITMALNHPEWNIFGCDISDVALRVAADNAKRLGASNVTFIKTDILNPNIKSSREYDIIVSNPPYVCMKERRQMDAIVADHEPSLALFVPDDDPLKFHKAIAAFAKRSLAEGGRLLFEINTAYHKEVEELLIGEGYKNVKVTKDQFDNFRIAEGTL
jgi:release factor glutamine methyltransferase